MFANGEGRMTEQESLEGKAEHVDWKARHDMLNMNYHALRGMHNQLVKEVNEARAQVAFIRQKQDVWASICDMFWTVVWAAFCGAALAVFGVGVWAVVKSIAVGHGVL